MKRSEFLQKSALATFAGLALPSFSGLSETDEIQTDKELTEHKITEIVFFDAEIKWPRFVGKNAKRDNHGTGNKAGACILKTNQGAIGWGLMEGRKDEYTKLAEELKGKKVSELFSVKEGMLKTEHKVFEISFFDLAGILLNNPVYKLLGAKKPIPNKVYSGMIYLDDIDPKENPKGIDYLLKECEYDYNFGYRQFKVKIGRGNMWMETRAGDQRDVDVTLEIAKAFPDCEILVDANDGYTPERFINYLKAIGSTKLFWVEEPFLETIENCKKLRDWMKASQFSKTYYADGEYAPDFKLMQELIDKDLIDVVLYDIIGWGFSKWRNYYPEMAKTKILASPHAWGSGIKTNYIAHLASVYGHTVTIEGVTSFSDEIDLTHYKIEKGMLVPPGLPGFGMKLLKRDL